jgi:hypothetical protein
MNFLNRPIFPLPINWSSQVSRSVTYDLRENSLGFGAEYFTPTATYDVTGWDFSIYHPNGESILQFECFADQLVGRLKGFWLPCPFNAAEYKQGISTTCLAIRKEGLCQTWAKRPDQFLFFTFPDGTTAAAQVLTVAAGDASGTWPADWNYPVDSIDPNLEYIFLSQPLPQVPSTGTNIQRLHYVRFAADAEEFESDAENMGTMRLSVVELPLEYTQQETGLQPIYLYAIEMDAPVNETWYYTSFAAGVASGGQLYQPWAMTHSAIKQTTDGNSNAVTLSAEPDPSHPFSILAGLPPGAPMWITIMRCYLSNPNAVKNIFVGYLEEAPDSGDKLMAIANSRLAWLKTKTPRFFIGSTCNWVLYDQQTCTVPPAFFTTSVTIQAVVLSQLPQLQVIFNFAFQLENWQSDDWFAGGTLQVGVGVKYEIRSIIGSEWVPPVGGNAGYLLLTLSAPLKKNGEGVQCQISAGCDHTANGQNGCKIKFNNFVNFGGFVDVPEDNLSLQGINTSNAMGNKKG